MEIYSDYIPAGEEAARDETNTHLCPLYLCCFRQIWEKIQNLCAVSGHVHMGWQNRRSVGKGFSVMRA